MAEQVSGIPFTPITTGNGVGRYDGAGAVMTWAQPTAGPGRSGASVSASTVKFSVEGAAGIRVCTDGSTPTATTLGVKYFEGFYFIENSKAELDNWKMWVPVGVTVFAEFGA